MTHRTAPQVGIEPWTAADLGLLRRANTPEMTEHVGGPEAEEQVLARHRRYLELDGPGRMFRIVLPPEDGPEGAVVGSIGFWELTWKGETVYETGWGVLPQFQGRGIAVAAARKVIAAARVEGRHGSLHAFPSVAHNASNTVCRKAGFVLVGECAFEYPKGRLMRSNEWRVDLAARARS
ncbi:GNAT family N-acetyltransferase [Streptomyces halobius]|uniref:GNAT family N-acetyltransferase n=1 Tax=Streptomyces halobius TaxID=2879846 RepID=A0ABY4MG43_9ACTN|nr:GNAT family N-acetyltransferase [Streptomyces halobius]UQA95336.1 GNAT family N-acetyltransferase [Streptomyces halobius]